MYIYIYTIRYTHMLAVKRYYKICENASGGGNFTLGGTTIGTRPGFGPCGHTRIEKK